MLLDPARLAEARAWLTKAANDLRAGNHDLTSIPPLTDDIVFHAQQAAEKAMKAFLSWHDQPFRKTHDLAEIGRLCTAIDVSLEALLKRAADLTVFAWAFRYPGDAESPTLEEARGVLALAQEVFEAVSARLPEAVHC
jgi:HEPN domain-containing protein